MTTRRETGHLLRRAGFGARPSDFEDYARLSWEAAVDRVLDYAALPDALPATPTPTQQRPDSDELRLGAIDVIGWWLERIIVSERSFEEKLVFFWHDHFATAITKAPPPLMANQVVTLRRQALGNFRDLLVAVATDPAMLVYLDGNTNVVGNPNENYARELYELQSGRDGGAAAGPFHGAQHGADSAESADAGWLARGGSLGERQFGAGAEQLRECVDGGEPGAVPGAGR